MVVAFALAALLARPGGTAPISLGPSERIVFYGDSITEQNRYAGLVETFLLTRYPDKHLDFFNYGWSGDTARGGNARFARDAAGAKPTLVFAAYGMNDGAYGTFADWILDTWLPPLKGIIGQARAGGARTVLLSPSVTDAHDAKTAWLKGYDDTLASMVAAEQEFGRAEGVPVVDLFTPMRAAMEKARGKKMATLVPDGIHPDRAGALLMAWSILRAFDPPKGIGEIFVRGSMIMASAGVKLGRPKVTAAGIAFDLEPPFLPFWVPWEARTSLTVCSFTEDLNRFRLVVGAWPAAPRPAAGGGATPETAWLMVDGQVVGRFTSSELEAGIDLTELDSTPWARTGRAIWELAERRNAMRFEAWRTIRLNGRDWGGLIIPGAEPGTAAAEFSERRMATAQALEAAGDAAAEHIRTLAQPRVYHVMLSTVAPYSPQAGLPKLVEGFEDPAIPGVACWDESVALSSATDHATEGKRALRVGFDAAVYGAPSTTIDFPIAQDFSNTPKLAVDVALISGSLPAGATASVTLTLNPEVKKGKGKKKDELKPVELKSHQTISDGGHATLVYELTGASAEITRRTASVSLTLSFSPTGSRGAVVYDNLRAIP